MKLYEGMVIVDDAKCSENYSEVAEHVQGLLKKNGGEVKYFARWDDRKLAYTIKKQSRGVYLLVYFDAPPENVVQINRDFELSDVVLRALFTVPMSSTKALVEAGENLEEHLKKPVPARDDDDGYDGPRSHRRDHDDSRGRSRDRSDDGEGDSPRPARRPAAPDESRDGEAEEKA